VDYESDQGETRETTSLVSVLYNILYTVSTLTVFTVSASARK
jgi:hypothetical protein